jgi:hypothetical protein
LAATKSLADEFLQVDTQAPQLSAISSASRHIASPSSRKSAGFNYLLLKNNTLKGIIFAALKQQYDRSYREREIFSLNFERR